jgi:Na+/H+ antiporter NhaD/arsenite permease-like protein
MNIFIIDPGFHAYAVMALVVLALVLFASERVPLATSSLLILVLLTLLFEIFPYQGIRGMLQASDLFLGFGHQALVAVCCLMIAGQALVRTGALEPVGRQLARRWAQNPISTFLFTLVLAAILSAFVNNTPVVILLLPILISVSVKTGAPASNLLMPMGLATSIGGMATSIGSSTKTPMLKFFARMGGMRVEFLLHTNASFLNYIYQRGVSHDEYEVRRLFDSGVAELLFPQDIYLLDMASIKVDLILRSRQRIEGE